MLCRTLNRVKLYSPSALRKPFHQEKHPTPEAAAGLEQPHGNTRMRVPQYVLCPRGLYERHPEQRPNRKREQNAEASRSSFTQNQEELSSLSHHYVIFCNSLPGDRRYSPVFVATAGAPWGRGFAVSGEGTL